VQDDRPQIGGIGQGILRCSYFKGMRVSRISMIHRLNNLEILELVSVHDDAKMTKVRILVAELITYFSCNNLRHAYMDPVTIPMCGFYKKMMMP